MRNLLLVAALVGLAACNSNKPGTASDSVLSQPPANPTGSMTYQSTGGGTGTVNNAPPANPTGSMTYPGAGTGTPAGVSATPPKAPTGSMQYPY